MINAGQTIHQPSFFSGKSTINRIILGGQLGFIGGQTA